MLEILKNKKCDKTNGKINFCIISEEELKVMIEIAKRENQELKKYKSLYQNEKSHTDTLKRIIKKIEEYINKNNLFCYKYDEEELFEIITDKEAKKYLLDLLKEIK